MRGSWALAALLLVQPALAQTRWVGSWATSQQVPEPRNALAPHDLDDATLRPTVHLSLGGEALRLKLSNAFSTAPLHVAAVHIARPTAPGSSTIHVAKMPAVNVGLLDGQLAWRQHDGGHTDAPNMKWFIQWVDRNIGHVPPQ